MTIDEAKAILRAHAFSNYASEMERAHSIALLDVIRRLDAIENVSTSFDALQKGLKTR